MPTPRTAGIFKSSSTNTKKPPLAPFSNHENDLHPEQCMSPDGNDVYPDTLTLCKQQLMNSDAGIDHCSNSTHQDTAQPDAALMDFWLLLQQTQNNLQDMLVDLETAKVELDLANERASEAQQQAGNLRVQLSASEQRCQALENQLHSTQNKEAQAATRLSALTQLNTQLTTEVQQAQSAAAALEIKLERMHGRLIAAQKEASAAAAAAAAAVGQDEDAATAAAAAAAAAEAAQAQMKSEIGHLKSELAGAQAKASRAELELAVARTKVLVAQQEAASTRESCSKLDEEVASLHGLLGSEMARNKVISEEKQKLERQVDTLSSKLAQKEARMRNSVDALAKASYKLRASFTAEGCTMDQNIAMLSAQISSDILKANAFRRRTQDAAAGAADTLAAAAAGSSGLPLVVSDSSSRGSSGIPRPPGLPSGLTIPSPAADSRQVQDTPGTCRKTPRAGLTPGGFEPKTTPKGSGEKKVTPRGSLAALLRRRSSSNDETAAAAAGDASAAGAAQGPDWSSPIFKKQRTAPNNGRRSSSGSSGGSISQTGRSLLSPRFLVPSRIPGLMPPTHSNPLHRLAEAAAERAESGAKGEPGAVYPKPPLSTRRYSSGTWGSSGGRYSSGGSSSGGNVGAAATTAVQKPDTKFRTLVNSIEATLFHKHPHPQHSQSQNGSAAAAAGSGGLRAFRSEGGSLFTESSNHDSSAAAVVDDAHHWGSAAASRQLSAAGVDPATLPAAAAAVDSATAPAADGAVASPRHGQMLSRQYSAAATEVSFMSHNSHMSHSSVTEATAVSAAVAAAAAAAELTRRPSLSNAHNDGCHGSPVAAAAAAAASAAAAAAAAAVTAALEHQGMETEGSTLPVGNTGQSAEGCDEGAMLQTSLKYGYSLTTVTAAAEDVSSRSSSSNGSTAAAAAACPPAAAAAVKLSVEPKEDQPAAEPPVLLSTVDEDSASEKGCEAAAAAVMAIQGPSISEITPVEDNSEQQQQLTPCVGVTATESEGDSTLQVAAAAAAAVVAVPVTPYDSVFAEINSQAGDDTVCLQQQHQKQQSDGGKAAAICLQQQQPECLIGCEAAAAEPEAALQQIDNTTEIMPEATEVQIERKSAAFPVPGSALPGTTASRSSRHRDRRLLLTSVLPAAAGAALAIVGGCSLAQARRLRRQQQVLMAAMMTTAAAAGQGAGVTAAAAAAASGVGSEREETERVRGMVVYKGTARRICSL